MSIAPTVVVDDDVAYWRARAERAEARAEGAEPVRSAPRLLRSSAVAVGGRWYPWSMIAYAGSRATREAMAWVLDESYEVGPASVYHVGA